MLVNIIITISANRKVAYRGVDESRAADCDVFHCFQTFQLYQCRPMGLESENP